MIELKNINKTFKVARRNAGFREAVKALFSKEYTYMHALNDVSFTINEGEMVGYIGPNGAEKSCTIKIMCGILTPDSGTCIKSGNRLYMFLPLLEMLFIVPCLLFWRVGIRRYKSTGS